MVTLSTSRWCSAHFCSERVTTRTWCAEQLPGMYAPPAPSILPVFSYPKRIHRLPLESLTFTVDSNPERCLNSDERLNRATADCGQRYHRWITARDRTRTSCPFIASTTPQRIGEEAHENGIGMPPPPAAAAKAMPMDSFFCMPSQTVIGGRGVE